MAEENSPSPTETDQDNEVSFGKVKTFVLLSSILLIALCGITYELIVATISSYFLGNSVFEFSLTIGLFMSAMGIGSFISRAVHNHLLEKFITVELIIGLIGGVCSPLLFIVFAMTEEFRWFQVGISLLIGTLVGLEIPILTRYLRQFAELRVAIAQVLSWDYIGALAGSVAFPVLLLPQLGLIGSSLAVGLVNLLVAFVGVLVFWKELRHAALYLTACVVVLLSLAGMFVGANGIEHYIDSQLYRDQVVYSEQTRYQKIVVTRWRDDLRLFINGNIQFSSIDEYRYHEALVHIPTGSAASRESVLILGGGDGLAVREVRKWGDEVKKITLVDLDPAMTRAGESLKPLVELNEGAMADERLVVVNDDAMNFLAETDERFDVILIDLPDPNHEALSKLYSVSFYRLVRAHLTPGGVFVTQSTSPYYSTNAFWCIEKTVRAAFCMPNEIDPRDDDAGNPNDKRDGCHVAESVHAYHANVPNFGDWGFVMAARDAVIEPEKITLEKRVNLRFLSDPLLSTLFVFPRDQQPRPDLRPNRLIDPVLLDYYLGDWSAWNL